jgi:transposase
MLQITPQMRVLVAMAPADVRRGIDGLVRLCREQLGSDPFSGAVFVFRNRPATAVKLLVYDGQGFWPCHKGLSTGRFRHWPKGDEPGSRLLAQELQVLLSVGNPHGAGMASLWRPFA